MKLIIESIRNNEEKKALELIKLIPNKYALINESYDNSLNNALILSVSKKYFTLTEQILEKGATPNVKNLLGVSPLHIACQQKNIKVIKLLISKGANLIPSNYKKTPFILSLESSTPEISNIIIDEFIHSKNINTIYKEFNTYKNIHPDLSTDLAFIEYKLNSIRNYKNIQCNIPIKKEKTLRINKI